MYQSKRFEAVTVNMEGQEKDYERQQQAEK